MKLYYSNTSPYSRKVRLCLRELGLQAQIEEQLMLPFNNPEALHAANPLGKIPALSLADDKEQDGLFDSPLICRYLDSLSSKTSLIPSDDRQWPVLRNVALADGLTDAAFSLVMENLRPVEQQSALWQQRWNEAIARSLDELEKKFRSPNQETKQSLNLGHLAIAAALAYLSFRLPTTLTEQQHPACWLWLQAISQRPSMQATAYVD